jgi:hypothetical protein
MGYGFSRESFELALLEGGIVGGMFAIPTGLITYYVILKRDLTVLRLAVVVLGSLVLGITTGMAIFWLSAFVTPVLTLALAFFARFAPVRYPILTKSHHLAGARMGKNLKCIETAWFPVP